MPDGALLKGRSMDQQHAAQHADDQACATEALGFAAVFETCASAFLNEPSDALIEKVRLVAQAVDNHGFDQTVADAALKQRYADRIYVTSSPYHVPLLESCIVGSAVAQAVDNHGFDQTVADAALKQRYADRIYVTSSPYHVPLLESCIVGSAADEHGVVRYGPSQSNRGDHVYRCYKTLQFNIEDLPGSPVAVKSLKADSLASELAFLAFMKNNEATSWQMGDRASAQRWHDFARTFAKDHANVWMPTAVKWMAATEDDFYARVCDLAAEAVSAQRWHDFARTFAKDHANVWMPTAVKWMAATEDDFYARVCDLAAEAVAAVAKED